MSEVFDRATVHLQMADFAVVDQLGKLQLIGGGLQLLGRDPASGVTAAFALVVSIECPPEVFNEQYVFEVVLEDSSGAPVELPGPPPDQLPGSGGNGSAAAGTPVVRFGQSMQVEEPNFRGSGVPRRALPAQASVVLYFNNGLPLPAGQPLRWRARIDGDTRPGWTLPFFVPAPPAGPVLG